MVQDKTLFNHMQTFKKKITVDLKNTLQRMLATILIPDYLAFKNATL